MTRITFYSNVSDKQKTLTSLVLHALQKKHQVTVLTESEQAASTQSKALWSSSATGFIPNVLPMSLQVAETSVIIDWREKELCQDDILINLSMQNLTSFSRFRQLVELVGADDADKVGARQRYKYYRDRGYEIKHVDALHLANLE